MNLKIVTLTMNPCIDKNTAVSRVVTEHKLRCERPRFDPGGGGINVSRAIRKLGGSSSAFYTQGGPPGEMLHLLLEEEGVLQKAFLIQDWTRENFIAYEHSTGLQYRFGLPGPGLYEAEWKNILRTLETLNPAADFLVLSGSLPLKVPDDFYARCAQIAAKAGTRVVLDASKEPLKKALPEKVFLLKPNLAELEDIYGCKLENINEQKNAMLELVRQDFAENIIVSLGGEGALGASRKECYWATSPEVPIQSKVGAGDSMVGGLVLGFAKGWDLKQALAYGVAAGTAAVMTPGTELCRLEDFEKILPQINIRTL